MPMTNLYDFPNIVAVKFLIKKDNQVLLVREPLDNEWKPGKLGLPGGKPRLNESLSAAIERKLQEEVGCEIELKGIFRIMNIIMPERTAYLMIIAAEYVSGELNAEDIEATDIDWYDLTKIEQLSNVDFTEYHNANIIKLYLSGDYQLAPLSLIEEQDNRQPEIAEWMKA